MTKLKGLIAGASLAMAAAVPAQAASTFFGVTYSLSGQYTDVTKDAAHFTLTISGINGASDTEGGRFGVNAYAFNLPQNFLSASSPGFTFILGGLNSSGCNGSGSFFCFADIAPHPSTVLPANSTLTFTFDLAVAVGTTLDTYNPDFKVDWLGLKSNYDLISKNIPLEGGSITPFIGEVPIPGAVYLFGTGLVGLVALTRRRRKVAAVA